MDEPNKIKDGETKELEKIEDINQEISPEEIAKKKRTNLYIELALFFILGILIGVAVKGEAVKQITIGAEDYKMKIARQDYDINQLESDFVKKQMEEAEATEEDAVGEQGGEEESQEDSN